MAPKRPSPLEYPPSASSSEDEVVDSGDVEVMDDELRHADEEDEEVEQEWDDMEEEEDNVNHLDDAKTEKPSSNLSPAKTELKVDVKPVEDSKKRGKKVFSEQSDVLILKGLAEFLLKNGKDFMADHNELYEYVTNKLDVEVSKSQLMAKVNNLKRKYVKNDEKVTNGEQLEPREQKLYELSRKIWGDWDLKIVTSEVSDVGSLSSCHPRRVKQKKIVMIGKNDKLLDSEMDEVESDDASLQFLVGVLKSKVGFGFGLNEEWARRGLCLIGKTKRVELVKKWEQLLVEETKLNLIGLELIQEQGQLALEALLASAQWEFDNYRDA